MSHLPDIQRADMPEKAPGPTLTAGMIVCIFVHGAFAAANLWWEAISRL